MQCAGATQLFSWQGQPLNQSSVNDPNQCFHIKKGCYLEGNIDENESLPLNMQI